MIEEVVLNGIAALLRNKLRLSEALHVAGERMKEMLSEAANLSNRILEAGPAEQRAFLLDAVKHIEMRRDRISIIIRTPSLYAVLGHGAPITEQARQGNEEFRLELPVTFKRRGVEMKLVMTIGNERPTPTRN